MCTFSLQTWPTHTLIINVKETRAMRNNQAVWRVSLMKCVSTARAQKSHSLNHFINITESEHEKQTHDESLGEPQTTRAWVRMTFIKQRSGLPQTVLWFSRKPSTGALKEVWNRNETFNETSRMSSRNTTRIETRKKQTKLNQSCCQLKLNTKHFNLK